MQAFIRDLCLCTSDNDITRTLSCNLVSYCITTPSLVCSAHYNNTVWRITQGTILGHSLKEM